MFRSLLSIYLSDGYEFPSPFHRAWWTQLMTYITLLHDFAYASCRRGESPSEPPRRRWTLRQDPDETHHHRRKEPIAAQRRFLPLLFLPFLIIYALCVAFIIYVYADEMLQRYIYLRLLNIKFYNYITSNFHLVYTSLWKIFITLYVIWYIW